LASDFHPFKLIADVTFLEYSLYIIVTCGLKAATCASAGRGFAGRIPVVTKYTVTLGFDGTV
jgi:hypothetical protein